MTDLQQLSDWCRSAYPLGPDRAEVMWRNGASGSWRPNSMSVGAVMCEDGGQCMPLAEWLALVELDAASVRYGPPWVALNLPEMV